MTTITTFDAAGNVLQQAPAKSNANRISIRLVAWQKQLDAMYTPEAVRGIIGSNQFVFRDGRSQWVD